VAGGVHLLPLPVRKGDEVSIKILPNLEQRTEAWYEARRGIVTASAVGKLITERKLGAMDFDCPACSAPKGEPCRSKVKKDHEAGAPIKTLHSERTAVSAANKTRVVEVASNDESRALTATLVAERIYGFTDPTWQSNDMFRGVVDEPYARDAYAKHFGVDVQEVGFVVRDFGGFKLGLSPDGLVGDDGGIEIKSRRTGRHVQTVLAGTVPPENVAQVQCALLVTGRKWWDYVDYAGGTHLFVTRVYPNPIWQRVIVEAVKAFEANAQEMTRLYEEAVAGFPMTDRIELDLEVI